LQAAAYTVFFSSFVRRTIEGGLRFSFGLSNV